MVCRLEGPVRRKRAIISIIPRLNHCQLHLSLSRLTSLRLFGASGGLASFVSHTLDTVHNVSPRNSPFLYFQCSGVLCRRLIVRLCSRFLGYIRPRIEVIGSRLETVLSRRGRFIKRVRRGRFITCSRNSEVRIIRGLRVSNLGSVQAENGRISGVLTRTHGAITFRRERDAMVGPIYSILDGLVL